MEIWERIFLISAFLAMYVACMEWKRKAMAALDLAEDASRNAVEAIRLAELYRERAVRQTASMN